MECILQRAKFFIAASSLNTISCLFIYALNIKLKKYYKKEKSKMDYSFEEFNECEKWNVLFVFVISVTNFIVAYMIFQ